MPEDGNNHLQVRNQAELFLLEAINKRKKNKQGKKWALCFLLSSYLDQMAVWKVSCSLAQGLSVHTWVKRSGLLGRAQCITDYFALYLYSCVFSCLHLQLASINTEYRKPEHFRPVIIIYLVHRPSPWVQAAVIYSNFRTQLTDKAPSCLTLIWHTPSTCYERTVQALLQT